ncbi:Uma2 family endonuclease, partial [Bradyrhizobium sp. NBAIM08]|uniref:Uma2 family endonuclease n=1 Tax=Bradyrhizobium sp. NBAIM08 TaxID=2793815 RepID=UPI001CD71FAB
MTEPPFICIEILSPEDRVPRVQNRIEDYVRFGVPYVWMFDPAQRRAWRCLPGQTIEVTDLLRTEQPEI